MVVLTQDWHPPNHVSFAKMHKRKPKQTIQLRYTEDGLLCDMQHLYPNLSVPCVRTQEDIQDDSKQQSHDEDLQQPPDHIELHEHPREQKQHGTTTKQTQPARSGRTEAGSGYSSNPVHHSHESTADKDDGQAENTMPHRTHDELKRQMLETDHAKVKKYKGDGAIACTFGLLYLCLFQYSFKPCVVAIFTAAHTVTQMLWPDHCIANTTEASLHQGLSIEPHDLLIRKGTQPHIDAYSAFYDNGHVSSTGLHQLLQQEGISHVYVTGVALEYCVLWSALDAAHLGFETFVIRNATAAVDAAGATKAVAEMEKAGVTIVDDVWQLLLAE
eukprot:jgi/Chrzof1/14155/Cz08g27060.t1